MPTAKQARSSLYQAASRASVDRVTHTQDAERAQPEISFFDWSMRVPEPKAGPLDFDRFPFQRELYEETGLEREVVVMKSTQIGISAYLVRETMFWADVKGWTVIYVFPGQKLMHDFADARVRTLILASKYLRGRVTREHTQNKGLRRIGSGFVYYRGSESEAALESIDADAIALDEYDSLVAANIPVAERRITGSPHGLIRRVGVPSIPGFGLDALYEESDQRRWRVKCGHCREWQPIYFFAGARPDEGVNGYVDQDQMRVVCGKCKRPLDVAVGEWVPTFPDRSVRGYHASRLIVPAVAQNDRDMLTTIVRASEAKEPYEIQGFHNRDLGEAYAPKEGRLSLEAIQAAQDKNLRMAEGYQGDRLVTAGIDVATTRSLNVRVSAWTAVGRKYALWIGTCDSFDEVDEILTRFRVNMFAIDHLPEGRLARSLIEKHPGKGYLVALTGSQVKAVISLDDESRTITVRRTEAVDAMMSAIRAQRNTLPAILPEGYVKQLVAPVRYASKDDTGKVVVGYRSSGPDDFAFAEVFDTIAGDAWLIRTQTDSLQEGEIHALEDRFEFERSHLSEPENPGAGHYSPGMQTGYSGGFGVGEQEPGFNSPFDAWPDQ